MFREKNYLSSEGLAALVLGISILLGASPFLIENYAVENYRNSYNATVEFKQQDESGNFTLGIDADQDMGFGEVLIGSNVTKKLNITANKKALFMLKTAGNFSDVAYHGKWFYFKGKTQMPIEVNSRKPGRYSGEVVLDFQLPKNRLGRYWLDLKYFYYNQIGDLKNKM